MEFVRYSHTCINAISAPPPPPPEVQRDYKGRHRPEIFSVSLLLFPASDLKERTRSFGRPSREVVTKLEETVEEDKCSLPPQ